MRRTVGRKKCKSARLKDSNHMVQRAVNVHLLQRDPIQRVHTERNSMNVAGCEAAAKIRHVLWILRHPQAPFRASSSRHDRICFVNGESRDEGVINAAKKEKKKLGQYCRLCAAANLILWITCASLVGAIWSLCINASTLQWILKTSSEQDSVRISVSWAALL